MPKPQTVPRLDVIKWVGQAKGLHIEYESKLGASVVGLSEEVLAGAAGKRLRGKVQLVFTSPPFPLNRKKKYGNREGESFKRWLKGYADVLTALLTKDGSIVLVREKAAKEG